MRRSYGTFPVFSEKELGEVLAAKNEELRAEVEGQADDYLLNVNEATYVEHLVRKHSVENLAFDFDNVFVSDYETDIPADLFPRTFFDRHRQSYRRSVVRWHIPFGGEPLLLHCVPDPRQVYTYEVRIDEGCLCLDIINFHDDAQEIKREAERIIDFLRAQSAHVVNQVQNYNERLPHYAKEVFDARKTALLKKHNTLSALGVPIKKRSGIADTFAVPTPTVRQKIMVSNPVVTERGYKPEPALESSVYLSILQTIQDVGKQFERMPSTYAGKDEEQLRDHFLLILEPHFEGSATGETFNKSGKTDILLRYESSNVFVAECKFWRGPKSYLDAISQLLHYLTWRDSKAAVILFVDRQDFSSVLQAIEAETGKHSNYLGFVGRRDESWFNYRFHINGDPNREVKLAVLLFHIPSV